MPVISSRHNPLVRVFRDGAREAGKLLLDGARVIDEALHADVNLEVVALTDDRARSQDGRRLQMHLSDRAVPVKLVSDGVMRALSPVQSPSGAVALGTPPEWAPADVFLGGMPLIITTSDVQDPGNLGAIVRSAAAAGATGFVATGHSADPFGWKALRGSMGSTFRLPIVRHMNVHEAIALARSRQVVVVGLTPEGGTDLYHVDLVRPVMVLLGGEGFGLSEDTVRLTDETITIPMNRGVESLNVAVTAALVAYEAWRQRTLSQLVSTGQPI